MVCECDDLFSDIRAGNIKRVEMWIIKYGRWNEYEEFVCPRLDLIEDCYGRTPMYLAVYHDFHEAVDAFIAVHCNIDRPCANGKSPIHHVAKYDKIKLFKKLARAHVNLNIESKPGCTPLWYSVNSGYYWSFCAVKLLEYGVKINTVNDTVARTPLLRTIRDGNDTFALHLIGAGADVNVPNHSGVTPLMLACELKQMNVIHEIIELCDDVNVLDDEGQSAIRYLFKRLDKRLIAKIEPTIALFIKAGLDVNALCSRHHTPIYYTVKFNSVCGTKMLLDAGADPNLGFEPNKSAFFTAGQNQSPAMFTLLLSAGAAINTPLTTRKAFKGLVDSEIVHYSALIHACQFGDYDTIKLFIDSGANVRIADHQGVTPIHMLLMRKQKAVDVKKSLKLLIAAGASLYIISEDNNTALHLAANYHVKCVKTLLQTDIDINVLNNEHDSAFCILLRENTMYMKIEELIQMFIDKKVELNIKDKDQCTPIFYAVYYDLAPFIKMLLAAGADPTILQTTSETPIIKYTSDTCEESTVLLLLAAGARGFDVLEWDEQTKLIESSRRGHVTSVTCLLALGSDHTILDHMDRTALEVAQLEEREAVVQVLQAHPLPLQTLCNVHMYLKKLGEENGIKRQRTD